MSYYCDMEVTKKRIIDAAIIVFNNDPSGTLEMVADKANVTTRTLYRYFKDRKILLDFCRQEMALTCKAAMNAAFEASAVPLKQLELTLYACIDCGSKYAFFDKTNQKSDYQPSVRNEENSEYDHISSRWIALIIALQKEDIITSELTPEWIHQLFSGMINTTLRAISSGDVAPNNIKKFAWYSFSKSIGISGSNQ